MTHEASHAPREVVRIIQIGLGPIGQRMTHRIIDHPRLVLVGAVDIDEAKVGRDVSTIAGLDAPLDVDVVSTLAEIADVPADVAVVTTSSSLEACEPVLDAACSLGLAVVSTCEELSYPWRTLPAIAGRVDAAARAAGVAVLGTGVNPGFLMDLLPLMMSGVSERVDAVRVERYQDAGRRRRAFQDKVGAGLTVEQFRRRAESGELRHVGLPESMHMIAARMGWTLTRVEDRIDPLVANDPVERPPHARIAPGHVKGVHQVGEGWIDGPEPRKAVELIFHAEVGQHRPQDRIVIRGEPHLESSIPGGVHGDAATCSITANMIPRLLAARPGLRTMIDIDPPSCWQG